MKITRNRTTNLRPLAFKSKLIPAEVKRGVLGIRKKYVPITMTKLMKEFKDEPFIQRILQRLLVEAPEFKYPGEIFIYKNSEKGLKYFSKIGEGGIIAKTKHSLNFVDYMKIIFDIEK